MCGGGMGTGTQGTRHQGTVITRVSIRMAVDSFIYATLSGPEMSSPIYLMCPFYKSCELHSLEIITYL